LIPVVSFFDSARRRKLVLRRGRERAVANRHPWIFEGAIAKESGPADAAIADLVDDRGAALASGFYSAHSQIRLRAMTFGAEEFSLETIRSRVASAVQRRAPLIDEKTNAVRLIFSEGDELSGLIVDRYDEVLVAEITSAGLEKLKPQLLEMLPPHRAVYFKNTLPARRNEDLPTEDAVAGEFPGEIEILENGLKFVVSPRHGQKTGFFLDQRDNRLMVRDYAAGRRVLNLFGYTGGFGVNAAARGAVSVEEVDVSAPAIDGARKNHERNGTSDRATFVVADAFQHVRALSAAGAKFDLVVCDPPVFARSRAEIDRAARGYKDINLYAMRLVEAGGYLMTFSCSGHMNLDLFQKVIFSAALDAGRRVSFLKRLGAGSDHPVSLFCPESEYLKGFLLQVHS
jgi:23S rRNA (cytosine1962-C5)-methyltransferase